MPPGSENGAIAVELFAAAAAAAAAGAEVGPPAAAASAAALAISMGLFSADFCTAASTTGSSLGRSTVGPVSSLSSTSKRKTYLRKASCSGDGVCTEHKDRKQAGGVCISVLWAGKNRPNDAACCKTSWVNRGHAPAQAYRRGGGARRRHLRQLVLHVRAVELAREQLHNRQLRLGAAAVAVHAHGAVQPSHHHAQHLGLAAQQLQGAAKRKKASMLGTWYMSKLRPYMFRR